MRCPTCGAHNPDTAEWCTQCYESLATEDEEIDGVESFVADDADDADGAEVSVVDVHDPVARAGPVPANGDVVDQVDGGRDDGATVTTADSRFRRTSEGIDWQCEVCEVWNPIERTTCKSCHQPFARTVADAPQGPTREVSETTALLVSALVPGTGHILMGRTASGVARAVMFLIWLVGGFLLLREAAASHQSILPALPLLVGAVVLWLATAVDVLALVQGTNTEILRPRIFLWLAVGVLGLVMLSFLASAVQLPGVLKGGGGGG